MTSEDHVVEKLKGKNCLIKFKDGEELFVHVPELDEDGDAVSDWLVEVEDFINGNQPSQYFPLAGISFSRDSIKYVKCL